MAQSNRPRPRLSPVIGRAPVMHPPPGAPGRRPRWRGLPAALALGLCLLAFLGAATVSTVVFDRVPHVEDELAFVFQAKTLAAGRLTAPAPADPDFFFIPFVLVRDGQWFGKYPPGYPAVLALGVLSGQPWLLNPLAGALGVGLVCLIGRRLHGWATGALAAALLATSPFFLIQAGSFLSHVVSLAWTLLALLLAEVVVRRRSRLAAAGVGLALGMLFLTRPLTAVAIGLPFAVLIAAAVLRDRRRALTWLPALAAFLPFALALLAYNQLTTGNALRSAYELWWPYDRLGFGDGIGSEGDHTLAKGLFILQLNMSALADDLYGWPARLSLAPAALAALLALGRLAGRRLPRRPAERSSLATSGWDWLLIGQVASLVLIHILYWSNGQMYGPRYYFEAIGALALLSASGLLQGADLIARAIRRTVPAWPSPGRWTTAGMLVAVGALVASSALIFIPGEFRQYVGFYAIDGAGPRTVQSAAPHHAVVFITPRAAGGIDPWQDYAPFTLLNAVTLDGDVVYAIDLGDARNRTLLARYPDRAVYRYHRAEDRLERLTP